MLEKSESLLASFLRPFFRVFGRLTGFLLGVVLTFVIIAQMANKSKDEPERKPHYSPTIVANAKGERKKFSETAPIILKIDIGGLIGTNNLNAYSVRQLLVESKEGSLKGDKVKAILLHINSPGGTVTDSDAIYRAVKSYGKDHGVPIFAFVEGLCASGGMYIACACDKIFTSEASVVGSVGVLSPFFFNVSKLLDKIGVESKTITAGRGKDDLNPFRPWKEGEEESFKEIIERFYEQFVDVVVAAREKIDRNRLIKEYGAKIFSGKEAFERGFTDGYGYTIEDVIDLLAKEIGVENGSYQVIEMEKKISFADFLRDYEAGMTSEVRHKIDLSPHFDPDLMNRFLYLYLPN